MGEHQYRWSQQSLAELEEMYWDEIAPAMRRAGLSPSEERPSYEWLADNGFSGLAYALREHHDLTLTEFFEDEIGLADPSADAGPWENATDLSVQGFESFLKRLRTRAGPDGDGLAPSTVRAHRSRLTTYVRTYHDLHGPGIVDRAADPEAEREEYERVLTVLDELVETLGTTNAAIKYLDTIDRWYDHLDSSHYLAHDPSNATEQYDDLQRSDPDNEALDASQVRAIYREAQARDSDVEYELLVIATCAWGLRRNEVARLRYTQFVLDAGDPRIEFEERKNGPGSVTLLYGTDVLDARLDVLTETDDWNGYLFPSKRSQTGHIHENTVTKRFRSLADAAGVSVAGETPTPQYGRRFWYTAYVEAVNDLGEMLDDVVAEQGSQSADVARRNYMADETERKLRRQAMRERLAEAFESTP